MTPDQWREEARQIESAIDGAEEVDSAWLANVLRAHAAALEEIERLKEAVELLYDKWENGEDCHEVSGDEMGVFLGKAFQLSREEEDAILALLKGIPSPAPMQVLAQRAEQAERRAERLQAQVDSLMLEYCPDEMTPEQLAEWEKHQRAVPAERRAERLKVHAEAMHTGIKHDVKFCLLRPNEWAEKAADAYRADKGE